MYIYLLISLPHVNFCKIFIKAAFELKTKLLGSNDRFHSGSGVQELKSNKQFKESLVCHVHKITKKRKEKQAQQKKQQ